MNGHDHYAAAEAVLDGLGELKAGPIETALAALAEAQVHATLALAAMVERIAFPPRTFSVTSGGAEVRDR